jgi:hypothetical protein
VTVYDGSRATTVVTGLEDDVVYDFGLFAYDSSGTFGPGTFLQAMPYNKTRPTLEWKAVPDATWYGIRMFGRGGRNLDEWLEQVEPSWRVDRDLSPGRHMYQVRAYVPIHGPTRWGRPQRIRIPARIPEDGPMTVSPRGDVLSSQVRFVWDWVEDAIWYEVQICFAGGVWTTFWVQDVLERAVAGLPWDVEGKWRVRACGLDGRGRWSQWQAFEHEEDDGSDGDEPLPFSGEGGMDDFELHTGSTGDVEPGLRMSAAPAMTGAGQVLLTWESEPGRTYTVYGSTNLVEGEWFPVQTMVGDGMEMEFLHDGVAERMMFYRLGVE